MLVAEARAAIMEEVFGAEYCSDSCDKMHLAAKHNKHIYVLERITTSTWLICIIEFPWISKLYGHNASPLSAIRPFPFDSLRFSPVLVRFSAEYTRAPAPLASLLTNMHTSQSFNERVETQ